MVDEILDEKAKDVNVKNATLEVNVANEPIDVDVKNATLEVNVANEPIDVNVDYGSGEIYSEYYTGTTTIQRFAATEERFKSFRINNNDASYYLYVGSYRSVLNTFRDHAWELSPGTVITLYDIDISTLWYARGGGSDIRIRTIGILE